ncbi:MAG: UDP-N-acetylglucosamine 2-epimerase, partial [Nitrosopumilus sp.]
PRTQKILELENYGSKRLGFIGIIKPLGYFDFLALISQAKIVLTDSGGVQEETTFLGIPCLTLRENTERPITITQGTNVLCNSKEKILKGVDKILKGKYKKAKIPEFWDGKTAKRIIKILRKKK